MVQKNFPEIEKNVVSPSKQGSEHFFLCLLQRGLVFRGEASAKREGHASDW